MLIAPLVVNPPFAVTTPLAFTVVNVLAAAKLAPMITPSILSPVPSPSILIVPLAVKSDTVVAPARKGAYESIVTLPAVAPVSDAVLANTNESADSSQRKDTLLNDPLLNNKP